MVGPRETRKGCETEFSPRHAGESVGRLSGSRVGLRLRVAVSAETPCQGNTPRRMVRTGSFHVARRRHRMAHTGKAWPRSPSIDTTSSTSTRKPASCRGSGPRAARSIPCAGRSSREAPRKWPSNASTTTGSSFAAPRRAGRSRYNRPFRLSPERWQSGRLRQTRNLLYGNVPGVRIPPSPPVFFRARCKAHRALVAFQSREIEMAELKKIDVVQGSGTEARSGPVVVHYTGRLHDPASAAGHGKKFDSSLARRQPFDFLLARGPAIPAS